MSHVGAVEAAINAARDLTPVDQPLIELARVLARQMDGSGPAGPGSRLVGAYVTVVRALTTRLAPLVDGERPSATLARLRAERLQRRDRAEADRLMR